eukprot:gnl/Dysnectes_brevis/2501_a2991_1018.p1 GENE.gnl/Dysnectes_brevis/2501_a2991_1018~~gnl/Dysnectes_brevis/2501_a2991_1018.p1  ORF type:complete len:837 (+),score=-33.56 gnl/Dysnectes_brevis/2501_a2991_1018:173-2512(+)
MQELINACLSSVTMPLKQQITKSKIDLGKQIFGQMKTNPNHQRFLPLLQFTQSFPTLCDSIETTTANRPPPFIVVDTSSGWGKSQLAYTLMSQGYYVCFLPLSDGQAMYAPFSTIIAAFFGAHLPDLIDPSLRSREDQLVRFCQKACIDFHQLYGSEDNESKVEKWTAFWTILSMSLGAYTKSDSLNDDLDVNCLEFKRCQSNGCVPFFFLDELVFNNATISKQQKALRNAARRAGFIVICAGTAMSLFNMVNLSTKPVQGSASIGSPVWCYSILRLPPLCLSKARKDALNCSENLKTILLHSRPRWIDFLNSIDEEKRHRLNIDPVDLSLHTLLSLAEKWVESKKATPGWSNATVAPMCLSQLVSPARTNVLRQQVKNYTQISTYIYNGIFELGQECADIRTAEILEEIMTFSFCPLRLMTDEFNQTVASFQRDGQAVPVGSFPVTLPLFSSDVLTRMLAPTLVPTHIKTETRDIIPTTVHSLIGSGIRTLAKKGCFSGENTSYEDLAHIISQTVTVAASWTRKQAPDRPWRLPWIYSKESDYPNFVFPSTQSLSLVQFLSARVFQLSHQHLDWTTEAGKATREFLESLPPKYSIQRLFGGDPSEFKSDCGFGEVARKMVLPFQFEPLQMKTKPSGKRDDGGTFGEGKERLKITGETKSSKQSGTVCLTSKIKEYVTYSSPSHHCLKLFDFACGESTRCSFNIGFCSQPHNVVFIVLAYNVPTKSFYVSEFRDRSTRPKRDKEKPPHKIVCITDISFLSNHLVDCLKTVSLPPSSTDI